VTTEAILENQTAVVTGAGSGIGKGISIKYLHSGAKLVPVDIDKNRLASLTEEATKLGLDKSRILPVVGDVCDFNFARTLMDDTIKNFGKLDILVNNAGGSLGFAGKSLVETDKSQWDATINLNLYGVLNCMRFALPYMIRQRYGRIINLGSTTGMGDSVDGGGKIAIYAACKAAVIALTKAVAREVAEYGINVNCVSPGVVRTRVFERFPKEELDSIVEKTPLGRVGEPEDIANICLFLASKSSEWLTGQNICASGGLVMH